MNPRILSRVIATTAIAVLAGLLAAPTASASEQAVQLPLELSQTFNHGQPWIDAPPSLVLTTSAGYERIHPVTSMDLDGQIQTVTGNFTFVLAGGSVGFSSGDRAVLVLHTQAYNAPTHPQAFRDPITGALTGRLLLPHASISTALGIPFESATTSAVRAIAVHSAQESLTAVALVDLQDSLGVTRVLAVGLTVEDPTLNEFSPWSIDTRFGTAGYVLVEAPGKSALSRHIVWVPGQERFFATYATTSPTEELWGFALDLQGRAPVHPDSGNESGPWLISAGMPGFFSTAMAVQGDRIRISGSSPLGQGTSQASFIGIVGNQGRFETDTTFGTGGILYDPFVGGSVSAIAISDTATPTIAFTTTVGSELRVHFMQMNGDSLTIQATSHPVRYHAMVPATREVDDANVSPYVLALHLLDHGGSLSLDAAIAYRVSAPWLSQTHPALGTVSLAVFRTGTPGVLSTPLQQFLGGAGDINSTEDLYRAKSAVYVNSDFYVTYGTEFHIPGYLSTIENSAVCRLAGSYSCGSPNEMPSSIKWENSSRITELVEVDGRVLLLERPGFLGAPWLRALEPDGAVSTTFNGGNRIEIRETATLNIIETTTVNSVETITSNIVEMDLLVGPVKAAAGSHGRVHVASGLFLPDFTDDSPLPPPFGLSLRTLDSLGENISGVWGAPSLKIETVAVDADLVLVPWNVLEVRETEDGNVKLLVAGHVEASGSPLRYLAGVVEVSTQGASLESFVEVNDARYVDGGFTPDGTAVLWDFGTYHVHVLTSESTVTYPLAVGLDDAEFWVRDVSPTPAGEIVLAGAIELQDQSREVPALLVIRLTDLTSATALDAETSNASVVAAANLVLSAQTDFLGSDDYFSRVQVLENGSLLAVGQVGDRDQGWASHVELFKPSPQGFVPDTAVNCVEVEVEEDIFECHPVNWWRPWDTHTIDATAVLRSGNLLLGGLVVLPWDPNMRPTASVLFSLDTPQIGLYRVTYRSLGDAVLPGDSFQMAGDEITPNITATREGYTLLGWSRNPGATTPEVSLVVEPTTNVLYAVWQATSSVSPPPSTPPSLTPAPIVTPLLPTVTPGLTRTDTTLTCTVGEFSQTITEASVRLVIDGVREPAQTLAAGVRSATWPAKPEWAGASITCEVFVRAGSATSTTQSGSVVIPKPITPTPTPTPTPTVDPTTPSTSGFSAVRRSVNFTGTTTRMTSTQVRGVRSWAQGNPGATEVICRAAAPTTAGVAQARARAQAVCASVARVHRNAEVKIRVKVTRSQPARTVVATLRIPRS